MKASKDIAMDVDDAEALKVDRIRCQVYGALAICFAFPSEDLPKAAKELHQISTFFYDDIAPVEDAPNVKNLEPDYINVLDGLDRERRTSPYEGAWTQGDRAKRQWEITRFYKAFGLKLPKDRTHASDHIAHEFEFMQALTYWAADHSPQNNKDIQSASRDESLKRFKESLLAQRDFLTRHIAQWVPTFCENLAENTTQEFYKTLALFTARFVVEDLAWVEERWSFCGK